LGQQAGIGRQHFGRQQLAHLGRDALSVGGGHRFGEVLDRTPEQALFRIGHGQGLQLGQHLVHDGAGLGHAGLQAVAHVGDAAVEDGHGQGQALEPVVVVLGRLEGLDGLARAHLRQEAGQAADLADGLHPVREAFAGQVLFQVELEDAVGDAVLGVQLGLVEAGQGLELLLHLAPGLGAVGGGRRVDEAVVVARVAQRRGEDGLALQGQLPLSLQPLMEAFALGGGKGGQAQRQAEGKQAQGVATAHGISG
jgi:hypothetical protein